MRITHIMAILVLAGCSNTVPVHMTFPDAPASLLQPAPALIPLPTGRSIQLSDILDNANTNYGQYHEMSARLSAWTQWYNEQRRIFDEVK
jgi:hypothetical protein